MNPNSTTRPLTFDEAIRLALHLAEKGHATAAFQVIGLVLGEAVMAAMTGQADQ